jgi:predicted nucleic acid-binding protein
MITAVDTNILLDVFLPDDKFAPESAKLLKSAYDQGAIIICSIVYAELVPQFADMYSLNNTLEALNITCSPLDSEIAYIAGERWALYRKSGGKRMRIITDFLIGVHAMVKAERFMTRDRGFYQTYFPDLDIVAKTS